MNLQIIRHDNHCTVSLSGEFTFADNIRFKQVLELAEDSRIKAIQLDFSTITYIDSSALGMLMLLYRAMQTHQQSACIIGAHSQAHKVLTLSHFGQYFKLIDS